MNKYEINKIVKKLNDISYQSDEPWEMVVSLEDATKIVKDIEENQWIPCSKALPKDSYEYVLIQVKRTGNYEPKVWYTMEVARYESDKPVGFGKGWVRNGLGEVIAWMPLPEPYIENK